MDAESARTALHRFGLGPRPGDIEKIASDPRGALLAELGTTDIAILDDADLPNTSQGFIAIRDYQMDRRLKRDTEKKVQAEMAAMSATGPSGAPVAPMPGMTAMAAGEIASAAPKPKADVPTPPSVPQAYYRDEIDARTARQRAVSIGFVERLVLFWTNHFAVQADKDEMVRGLAGAFEREAIRPFVLGRFEDMLVAATRHPAMLLSLDNAGSIGPDSRAGKKRDRGLNENHARELLELHTIGVDGGYSQSDVTAFARILTGWTFERNVERADAGVFRFQPNLHEPGDQTVMGKVYRADVDYPVGNEGQGLSILHDLAVHPATARHIAGKLARHFVADDPPQALVDRIAAKFTSSGGDLKAIAETLVRSDEAWAPGRKFTTPQRFLTASIRALDVDLEAQRVIQFLNVLGQPYWTPPSPEGFHDDAGTWLAPDGLTSRLDIADRLAQQAALASDPMAWTVDILGVGASQETVQAIRRAESARQAAALLVMSPEFQWS
ncbi:DUF1800 family protein [Kaistia dalseonensis]|uniref:Uncharacterized protein (DUF1800 family) n=1 Tax=Kaistia dalseonensis TaxID=410840 RepID=A0ABU0H0E0_9HYPH|nr:DUF1800 family protein [Kaistia dalseonensis]MCX5493182.1 DUF1800 family protein [Kaistia dalseonensis]MDQ0435737.1 uncharacterized protein (DUF1800 family) [Kaistia dalseonensis]